MISILPESTAKFLRSFMLPMLSFNSHKVGRVKIKQSFFLHFQSVLCSLEYECLLLLFFSGNKKKSFSILQKALTLNAKPVEHIQTALKNLHLGKTQLFPDEDKENITGQFCLQIFLVEHNGLCV